MIFLHEVKSSPFRRETPVRGKFAYPCVECRQIIPKGVSHWYVVWGSRTYSYSRMITICNVRICYGCRQVWEDLKVIFDYEIAYCFGHLTDTIAEAIDLGYLKADDPLVHEWLPERFQKHRPTKEDGQLELMFT